MNVKQQLARFLIFLTLQLSTHCFKTYVRCQVGANNDPNIEGCFASNGTLTIEGFGEALNYAYQPTTGNKNGVSDNTQNVVNKVIGKLNANKIDFQRTIQGFSTTYETKMRGAPGKPFFPVFQKFVDFYGSPTYADDWLQACFTKGSTTFKNGNANFAGYGDDGRVGKR